MVMGDHQGGRGARKPGGSVVHAKLVAFGDIQEKGTSRELGGIGQGPRHTLKLW